MSLPSAQAVSSISTRYDIFLSFSGSDKVLTSHGALSTGTVREDVIPLLKRELSPPLGNWNVFFDEDIRDGSTIRAELEAAILATKGGGVGVFLITDNYLQKEYPLFELSSFYQIKMQNKLTGVARSRAEQRRGEPLELTEDEKVEPVYMLICCVDQDVEKFKHHPYIQSYCNDASSTKFVTFPSTETKTATNIIIWLKSHITALLAALKAIPVISGSQSDSLALTKRFVSEALLKSIKGEPSQTGIIYNELLDTIKLAYQRLDISEITTIARAVGSLDEYELYYFPTKLVFQTDSMTVNSIISKDTGTLITQYIERHYLKWHPKWRVQPAPDFAAIKAQVTRFCSTPTSSSTPLTPTGTINLKRGLRIGDTAVVPEDEIGKLSKPHEDRGSSNVSPLEIASMDVDKESTVPSTDGDPSKFSDSVGANHSESAPAKRRMNDHAMVAREITADEIIDQKEFRPDDTFGLKSLWLVRPFQEGTVDNRYKRLSYVRTFSVKVEDPWSWVPHLADLGVESSNAMAVQMSIIVAALELSDSAEFGLFNMEGKPNIVVFLPKERLSADVLANIARVYLKISSATFAFFKLPPFLQINESLSFKSDAPTVIPNISFCQPCGVFQTKHKSFSYLYRCGHYVNLKTYERSIKDFVQGIHMTDTSELLNDEEDLTSYDTHFDMEYDSAASRKTKLLKSPSTTADMSYFPILPVAKVFEVLSSAFYIVSNKGAGKFDIKLLAQELQLLCSRVQTATFELFKKCLVAFDGPKDKLAKSFNDYKGEILVFEWKDELIRNTRRAGEFQSEFLKRLLEVGLAPLFADVPENSLKMKFFGPVSLATSPFKKYVPTQLPSYKYFSGGIQVSGFVEVNSFNELEKAERLNTTISNCCSLYIEAFSKQHPTPIVLQFEEGDAVWQKWFLARVVYAGERWPETAYVAVMRDLFQQAIGFVYIEWPDVYFKHSFTCPVVFIGEIAILPSYASSKNGTLLICEALWLACAKWLESHKLNVHDFFAVPSNEILFFGWVGKDNDAAKGFYNTLGARAVPAEIHHRNFINDAKSPLPDDDLIEFPLHGYNPLDYICYYERIKVADLKTLIRDKATVLTEKLVGKAAGY